MVLYFCLPKIETNMLFFFFWSLMKPFKTFLAGVKQLKLLFIIKHIKDTNNITGAPHCVQHLTIQFFQYI